MKRSSLLAVLIFAAIRGVSAWAYDFEKEGIYYTIISEEARTVAVVCGDTTTVPLAAVKTSQEPCNLSTRHRINEFDYMWWKGNSYAGDVVVPARVQSPGVDAWYTVTELAMGAFCYCYNLRSVSLPYSLQKVGPGAFCLCTSLEEVIIPDEVTEVGENAFEGCSSLRHVHFPLAAILIPNMIFHNAGASEGMRVSGTENVLYMGYRTFQNSTLNTFPELPNLITMGFAAFEQTLLETVNFPATCKAPESEIFNNCSNLTTVFIPASVNTPENLFNHNASVTLIRYYASTPPILPPMRDISSNVSPTCVLEVPESSVETYKSAKYWENFAEIRAIPNSGMKVPEKNAFVVNTVRGGLTLTSEKKIQITNLVGVIVYSGPAATVNLPCGMYIVSDGETSAKVIVK